MSANEGNNQKFFWVELIKSILSIPTVLVLLIICLWGSIQKLEEHLPQMLNSIKVVKFKDFALEISQNSNLKPSPEIESVLTNLSKSDLLKLSNFRAYNHTPSQSFAELHYGNLMKLGLIIHADDPNMPKDKYVLTASATGKKVQEYLDDLIISIFEEVQKKN